jgi:hypothetical protein
MAELSRRTFLGASAAAAGAAVIGVPIASAAASSGTATAAPALAAGGALLGAKASGPLVVYVPDTTAGDVAIMVGTEEVTYHDPDLVARLARAAGGNG